MHRRSSDEVDDDFLNSFIAADLAQVANRVRDGNYGGALRAYLSEEPGVPSATPTPSPTRSTPAPPSAWTVTRAVVDEAWQASADPAHDVAFLVVDQDGAGSVEDVTGGYQLVTDPGPTSQVDAIGYPDFADAPAAHSGTTSQMSPTQLELDALGLYDGASGGPWVRSGDQVIAVTGGYEQGGVTPEVSYASYLDDSTQRLLADLDAPDPDAGSPPGS